MAAALHRDACGAAPGPQGVVPGLRDQLSATSAPDAARTSGRASHSASRSPLARRPSSTIMGQRLNPNGAPRPSAGGQAHRSADHSYGRIPLGPFGPGLPSE